METVASTSVESDTATTFLQRCIVRIASSAPSDKANEWKPMPHSTVKDITRGQAPYGAYAVVYSNGTTGETFNLSVQEQVDPRDKKNQFNVLLGLSRTDRSGKSYLEGRLITSGDTYRIEGSPDLFSQVDQILNKALPQV